MVGITLEKGWMVSDKKFLFSIFRQISHVKFHTCNNFQFFNYHRACYLCIKKAPDQVNICQDLIKKVSITLEGLWMVSAKIFNFQFFIKFHRSEPAIIFRF